MCLDIKVSKEMQIELKKLIEEKLKGNIIEFNVTVLTKGSWPITNDNSGFIP